jgi:hypothetical protein
MHKIRQKICNNCGLRYSAESLRNVFAKNCNWKINICLAIEALAELALAGSAIFFCVNARDTSYGFHQQVSQQSTTKKKEISKRGGDYNVSIIFFVLLCNYIGFS